MPLGIRRCRGDAMMPWGPGDAMGMLCQDTDGEQHGELEEPLGCFEGAGKGERVSETLLIVPKKCHAGLTCAR